MPELTFEQILGGIEDGIVTALTAPLKEIGAKSIGTYSGELDAESLKKELAGFAAKCPRVLVSYASGVDKQDPAESPVGGRPLTFKHDCWFAVIVASNNPRSEHARRRGFRGELGTYQMISKVREVLTGRLIKATVDGDEVPLTYYPLMPVSNSYVLRIPKMTAYAIVFSTFFRWTSPDRTSEGIPVTSIELDVDSLNGPRSNPGNLPGVEVE